MFAESPAQPASNMQIAEHKEAAIRGLSNYMFMEAQRMAKVCIRYLPLYACEPKAHYTGSLLTAHVLQEGSGSPADKFQG